MKHISTLAIILCISTAAFSQAGTLDKTFSDDGKAITGFGFGDDNGSAVAIQKDGKILVAGAAYNGLYDDFGIVRYNKDGTRDLTFGVLGTGKVTTNFGGNDVATCLAIQQDGKIVVAGYTTASGGDYDFAAARYNTDGTLDNTFGGDGLVITGFGWGDDYGFGIAIQSDGKIVVAGTGFNGHDKDFAVVRYNKNGTRDNLYDGDGRVLTDFGDDEEGRAVAIQSNDNIVVAGGARVVQGQFRWTDFAVARYNTNGTLDHSFGGDGKVLTDFSGGTDFGEGIAIQSDGKILVGGSAQNGWGWEFGIARYNTNGSLDNTFSGDGKVTTLFNDYEAPKEMAIQSDGKILAAGDTYIYGGNYSVVLARYKINGALDDTFGKTGDGKVITSVSGADESASSIAIQSDGKIVLAGNTTESGGDHDFLVLRYHGDNAAPEIITSELPSENIIAKEKLAAVHIYPNPVTNVLNIQGLDASLTTTISITNLSGTVLHTATVTSSEYKYDASMLKPGVYYVSVVEKDKTINLKFIKQ